MHPRVWFPGRAGDSATVASTTGAPNEARYSNRGPPLCACVVMALYHISLLHQIAWTTKVNSVVFHGSLAGTTGQFTLAKLNHTHTLRDSDISFTFIVEQQSILLLLVCDNAIVTLGFYDR